MQTAFNVAVDILLLFVAAWILVFGGIGSLLSGARGGTRTAGFLWGVLAGPVGWLAILWTTRGDHGVDVRAPRSTSPGESAAAEGTAFSGLTGAIDVAAREGKRL